MKPVKQAVYSSRTADKFVVRLTDGLRERIAEIARKHHRSMNSQIISWMDICVDLEDAGVAVTRDSLSEVANILKTESEKPVIIVSIGETVRVPERFCNDLSEHIEVFGNKPRTLESETEIVQVFALGRITEVVTNGFGTGVKVCWLHTGCESKWIPFPEVQQIK